jgi:hypothetical protein
VKTFPEHIFDDSNQPVALFSSALFFDTLPEALYNQFQVIPSISAGTPRAGRRLQAR